MKLEDLLIHDSEIKLVTENPVTDDLTFYIDWPKDWENQIFVDADLIFTDVINYEVHEGPFAGSPTILEIVRTGIREDHGRERQSLKIETNAGYRTLSCTGFKLVERKS